MITPQDIVNVHSLQYIKDTLKNAILQEDNEETKLFRKALKLKNDTLNRDDRFYQKLFKRLKKVEEKARKAHETLRLVENEWEDIRNEIADGGHILDSKEWTDYCKINGIARAYKFGDILC